MVTQVVVFGEKHAASVLEGIADRAANARPAMEEIYLTILDIEDEAFANEGARSGFPRWANLSMATILWKAKHKYHPAILQATGLLREVMTTYRHPGAVVRISALEITVQPKLTVVPYARIQQKGGRTKMTQGKGPGGKVAVGRYEGRGGNKGRVKFARQYTNIPARPYVRFSEADATAFGKEVMRHIMRPRRGSMGVMFSG